MRHLLLAMLLTSSVSAQTYRFADGDITRHDNRCASPSAVKRVREIAARSKLTLGHDQATLTIDDVPYGADFVGDSWSRYVFTPQLTIIVRFDALACADSHCRAFRATLSVIQRYEGATCYEQWSGNMELVK